eukprot:Skav236484  [mRNA]  locus=scaffold1440:205334:210256:- [translate_table: standard]
MQHTRSACEGRPQRSEARVGAFDFHFQAQELLGTHRFGKGTVVASRGWHKLPQFRWAGAPLGLDGGPKAALAITAAGEDGHPKAGGHADDCQPGGGYEAHSSRQRARAC